jgi:hypothetical protein
LAPSYEYWLKFLSSTRPTSVTTPIFRLELGAALGTGVAELEHAATNTAVARSPKAVRSLPVM